MKYKAGDKVWVIRTTHPGAPVPAGAVRAGVVLSTWCMRPSGQTYMVDIPSVPHPRNSFRTEWVVYEHRMRPRDEDGDSEPADRFGDSTPDKLSHWGRCPWVPDPVKAEYLKCFTPMHR